jgi:hypothetical protein
LSEIINHLLMGGSENANADDADAATPSRKPRPFDFLIDNEFLRTTLKRHLANKGVTTVAFSAAVHRDT